MRQMRAEQTVVGEGAREAERSGSWRQRPYTEVAALSFVTTVRGCTEQVSPLRHLIYAVFGFDTALQKLEIGDIDQDSLFLLG